MEEVEELGGNNVVDMNKKTQRVVVGRPEDKEDNDNLVLKLAEFPSQCWI